MTDDQIKEAISTRYIQTIANRIGYKTSSPNLDHGTDLSIIEVAKRRKSDGKMRHYDSGNELKIQLKCTTERSITRKDGFVIYDLEAKTYNDLVERLACYTPLILVVSILVDDENKWVICNSTSLTMHKQAYWYMPEADATPTKNTGTKRIQIPFTNQVTVGTIPSLFNLVKP